MKQLKGNKMKDKITSAQQISESRFLTIFPKLTTLEKYIQNNSEFNDFQQKYAFEIIKFISTNTYISAIEFYTLPDNELMISHGNNLGEHNIIVDKHNIFFTFYKHSSYYYISKSMNEHFNGDLTMFLNFAFLNYGQW